MLTDRQIRNASASTGHAIKLSDGEGLQLWLQPSGAKLWNMAYRFDGKQRKLAIGPYPRISLKDARARRDEAKRLLADGLDPSQQKRIAKLAATAQNANTFATIADELLAQKRREGKAPATIAKLEWLFGLAKPALGAHPITAIEAPEVLQVLRGVEARDRLETARRLRLVIGSAFRFCRGDRASFERSDGSVARRIDCADRTSSRGHYRAPGTWGITESDRRP